MNEKKFAEQFGNIDSSFVDEALDYKPLKSKGGLYMSKKKLVSIALAAALVVAIGATTAVASWSRLNQFNDFFDWMKDAQNIPDEVPVINDPEVYAKEVAPKVTTTERDAEEAAGVTSKVETYTPPAPGTAQITGVSATPYTVYLTIEFNAEGWDIPDEIPADARHDEEFHFEWADVNFGWSGGKSFDVSRDGNIFTYIFSRNNIREYPEDEIVITLQRFGYLTADKNFVTLRDEDVEVRLPVDEIDFMETVKSENSVNIMGIEHTAELSPYELLIWCNEDDLVANGLLDENGYWTNGELVEEYNDVFRSINTVIELHMTDGTVFTDHILTNEFGIAHIVGTMSGRRHTDIGICADYYGFEVPLDISQIDYIIFSGNRFDFAS